MKKFSRTLQVFLLLVITQNVFGQIVSAGPGDWSNPSTWVGNVPPTSADNVSIGHTVNIDNSIAASANLVFTAGGSINFNTVTSVLSIYGNATFGDGVTNISSWTSGAKLVFAGTALQTWTTGVSSRFDFVEINKTSGTVTQAVGAAIRIGTNLNLIGGGTFTIGSGTDIEGVQFANGTTATTPSIFVGTGSTFNIDAAAASFVRSGTTGTVAIGSVTINGTMNLGTTSGNGVQFGNVSVGDGTNVAVLNITTNMNSSGLYNFSGLTVNSNATFNMNSTTIAASTIGGNILGTGTVVYATSSSINHPAIDRSYGGNLIINQTMAWTTVALRTIGGSLTLNNTSVLTTTFSSGKLTISGDLNIQGTSRLSWASGNIDLGGNLLVSSTNSVVALYPQSASGVLACIGLNKSFTVQTGALVRCVATGTTPITTQYPGFNTVDFQSGSTIDYFKTSASTISIQDTYNGNNISYSKIFISHAASAGGIMAVTINNPIINSSLSIAQGSGTASQTFTQTVTFANISTLTIPSLTATSSSGAGTLVQNIVLGAQPIIVTGNVSLTDAAATSTATSCVLTVNAGSLSVNGTLTVGTTGAITPFNTPYVLLNDPASILTVTGITTLRSLEQTNGAIKFTNSSQVVNFNGSCTTSNGNSGAEVFNFNGTNATINFNNNFTDGALGSTFFVTGTEFPTINFNNGSLTVPLTSSSAGLRGNVIVSGYRQITGSNFRTSNASAAAYSMTINGTLDLGANGSTATNTGGGTNTLNGTGTIKLTGDYSLKVSAYSTNNFQTTGTLHLNGTTNQDLPLGTYQNIIADNTISVSLVGNATVNGSLSISKGSLITGANNLTLGASASATIGSNGALSITGGTTDFTSRPVAIQSGASSTGRIAAITGNNVTTGLINATAVSQERYILGSGSAFPASGNSKRGFRFIGHPFNASIGLSQINGANEFSISGSGGTINGFQATGSNNPSAFWYDPTVAGAGANTTVGTGASASADAGWTSFTNTNGLTVNAWKQGQGIRFLFRGDQTQGLLSSADYTMNPATATITGSLNVGPVTVNLTSNAANTKGFNVIGNPLPSPVDLSLTTSRTNMGANFWVFDPSIGNRGGYSAAKAFASSYIIPSSGAFVAEVTTLGSAASLIFPEASKASTPTDNLLRTNNQNNYVKFRLEGGNMFWDELNIVLGNQYQAATEYVDGAKFINSDVNFYSITNDNNRLSLDYRKLTEGQVIPLGLQTNAARSFTIKVTDVKLDAGATLYLIDNYLNTQTRLEPGATYDFVTTSNAASQGESRFEIGMKQSPVLPTLAATFSVKLSPNPAKDMVKVTFSNEEKAGTTITMINAEGKTVKTVDAGNVQSGEVSINVKGLAKGSYYVTLSNGKEKKTEKLQVQ